MRTLILLTLTLSLYAESASLQQFVHALKESPAARSAQLTSQARYEQDRSSIEPDGFSVEGALARADAKNGDREEMEYHLALEKEFTLSSADTQRYLDASKRKSLADERVLSNKLKTLLLRDYTSICSDKQRSKLLEDALQRNKALDALIAQGVESGEFDRTRSLQSELETEEIALRLRLMRQTLEGDLERLWSLTQMYGDEPLCSDLSLQQIDEEHWRDHSALWMKIQAQKDKSSKRYQYTDSWVPKLTAGIGYDDEMDVKRALAYVRVPLPYGDQREAKRSAALYEKQALEEDAHMLEIQTSSQIRVFNKQQKSRMTALQALKEVMIPKATEASALLKERFLGAEGTYFEYAQSRQKLFTLQNTIIDIRHAALLSQAAIYDKLGIDPTEESK